MRHEANACDLQSVAIFHLFLLLVLATAYRLTHQLHVRTLCQLLLLIFFDNITNFAPHLKVM